VAFDLAAISCVFAALSSQSVIGEINLLATVIPGQGRAVAGEVPPLCGENGFGKKFPPALPNYNQVPTDRTTPAQQLPDQSV
jgi:hypothetical protein